MPRKPASAKTKELIDAFMLRKKLRAALGRHVGVDMAAMDTNADVMVHTMVTQALEDPKAAAQLFKLVTDDAQETLATEKPTAQDWESLFAFFGKYKPLIEQEIAKRAEKDPGYWLFDWFKPTAESAPWYERH